MSSPLVSVIMPAFHAHAHIRDAVESVQKCGLDPTQVEIVIAAGDRDTYNANVPRWCPVKFTTPDREDNSVGEACNKALHIAQGRYVSYLNAHDLYSENYLEEALILLETSQIIFSRTTVVDGDKEILKLPAADVDRLDFNIMSQAGAMFHPIIPREMAGPYSNWAAEDILHAMEILSLNGGTAPLSKAPYIIRTFPSTMKSNDAFSVAVSASYQHFEREIRRRYTRVSDAFIPEAVRLLRRKSEINARYSAVQYRGHFYSYVAEEYQKGIPPWMGSKPSFELANP